MNIKLLFASLLAFSCAASATSYPVLTESTPEKVGLNIERLNRLESWIAQQVDAGYPSVNLLIIKDNHIVYRKA